MIEMICKHCKDEFCVNDQCPMRADYCPVPDTPGVCKHEERIEVTSKPHKLTPKECMRQAFVECGVVIKAKVREEVYESFRVLLAENGLEITEYCEENDEAPNEDDLDHIENAGVSGSDYGLRIGMTLRRGVVETSDYWHIKSFSGEPYNTSCCYVSVDEKWVIRFDNGCETGKIAPWYKKEEFIVGKQVHVGAIGESNDWVYIGEENDMTRYVTRDKLLTVSFTEIAIGEPLC